MLFWMLLGGIVWIFAGDKSRSRWARFWRGALFTLALWFAFFVCWLVGVTLDGLLR